jgi:hypothetical protein
MSAMPDTAVIVTGLVGAAGIAGTLLSARITARSDMAGLRLSIAAEEQRAQLAEKRRIYAEFNTSIDKLLVANAQMHEHWAAAGPDGRQALRSAQDAAMTALSTCLGEIMLIGPKSIATQAGSLVEPLLTYAGRPFSADGEEDGEIVLARFPSQRSALFEAMRADLGTGQAPAG